MEPFALSPLSSTHVAMCGRYTLMRHERIVDDFQASLGMTAQSERWKPRFNAAPTRNVYRKSIGAFQAASRW